MKNKHLVLLFILVLTGGLLCRNLPYFRQAAWTTGLFKTDTAAINKVILQAPGQPELMLLRDETGWLAIADNRTVPAPGAVLDSLLGAFAAIRSLRTVHTQQPDTLGLGADRRIVVQLFANEQLLDRFSLGEEYVEQGRPATFLALNGHEGVYLAEGHLRHYFSKDLAQFRGKTALMFPPETIWSVCLIRPDSMDHLWIRSDTLPLWRHADSLLNCPAARASAWLDLLNRLNGLPFADGFDDSQADRLEMARIVLLPAPGKADSAVLRIFHVLPPELPEDLSILRKNKSGIAAWVVHSSQNPFNYFALDDTLLARRICRALLPTQ
ncbi:MAG: DUF4340 domain-containing protein [Saprospiraceae bacterium]|nr:DUF4340 domain-containing protein [Saprospiraceae bacterium]